MEWNRCIIGREIGGRGFSCGMQCAVSQSVESTEDVG